LERFNEYIRAGFLEWHIGLLKRRMVKMEIEREAQDLKVAKVLTVYFGTPSMFITLWFVFDYGTNPPLGTLII
jgi:hypothetical protein